MSDALSARVARALNRSIDGGVAKFAEQLAHEAGAGAVMFYGSNLRTGSLEGVLDFYLLLPGPPEKGIWPRVSYREWEHEGEVLRAKIATMTQVMFYKAARGELIDTTIWARFVQPCALIWAKDDGAQAAFLEGLEAAAITAARLAGANGPAQGSEEDYWRALFRSTYKAELRVEKPGREDSILEANADHFAGLLPAAWKAGGIDFTEKNGQFRPEIAPSERKRIARWWNKRRRLGKALNIRRLIRASSSFDGAARYAAWKVERHTGVKLEVTPFRERHPLLAAPSAAWHIWRNKRA